MIKSILCAYVYLWLGGRKVLKKTAAKNCLVKIESPQFDISQTNTDKLIIIWLGNDKKDY